MTIINTLKKKRSEKGWSQLELAERSGVSQPTISQIERGIRKCSTHKIIMKLAEALEINVEELTDLQQGGARIEQG